MYLVRGIVRCSALNKVCYGQNYFRKIPRFNALDLRFAKVEICLGIQDRTELFGVIKHRVVNPLPIEEGYKWVWYSIVPVDPVGKIVKRITDELLETVLEFAALPLPVILEVVRSFRH